MNSKFGSNQSQDEEKPAKVASKPEIATRTLGAQSPNGVEGGLWVLVCPFACPKSSHVVECRFRS